MSRYVVSLEDGFGRETDRLIVTANNLRLALAAAEQALTVRDSGHGERAVAASVELLGEYEDDRARLEQQVEELRVRLCNLTADPAGRTMILAGVASGFGFDLAPRFGGGVTIPYACEVDESAGLREQALDTLQDELQSPGFVAAVTAMDAMQDALGEPSGLPEGSLACVCGAVTHWQGRETPDTCLRCGRDLLPPSLIFNPSTELED